ncbi:MAG: putative Sensor histidine kinase, partial [Verrucomicrobiales bacterium]|nr:putative Sensor histidine kinase [Verrucomicrobiales bacterium]
SMTILLAGTVASVQRIAADLRPGVLDDLGLLAALEWYAEEFEKRSRIRCIWTERREVPSLSIQTATTLFRIFQEALTNIGRHAKATEARFSLRCESHEVILEVSDNGKGFPAEDFEKKQSLGLLGMRERAHLVGGRVEIQSMPGAGATVRIRVRNCANGEKPANSNS